MTIRSIARSIYTLLPIPQGVKSVLQRLTATSAPTDGEQIEPSEETRAPLLCTGPPANASLHSFKSKPEFEEWMSNNKAALEQRLERELAILPTLNKQLALSGYCVACESNKYFIVDTGSNDGQNAFEYSSVNWRESLRCECCSLNNRMRASIDLFTDQLIATPSSKVYITEQVTPLYRWAKGKFPELIGSEYLGDEKTGGTDYEGIRHEDTTRLSLESDSLDCVLSFDVLEHIPDYQLAIKEIFRCLKPGGFLLLSAPFVSDNYQTRVRARLLPGGHVEHLLSPEYHGNPTQPGSGSLCYYHFGWDLLDEIGKAGATDVRVLSYYCFERGNFGKSQLFFWARKADLTLE